MIFLQNLKEAGSGIENIIIMTDKELDLGGLQDISAEIAPVR